MFLINFFSTPLIDYRNTFLGSAFCVKYLFYFEILILAQNIYFQFLINFYSD
jgi:hypothetical protein